MTHRLEHRDSADVREMLAHLRACSPGAQTTPEAEEMHTATHEELATARPDKRRRVSDEDEGVLGDLEAWKHRWLL